MFSFVRPSIHFYREYLSDIRYVNLPNEINCYQKQF